MEHREEHVSLAEAATFLLDECRMVLPGIQALFGFQLIAVFNPRFAQELSEGEQHAHLLALFLVAVAIALIMTPAALHRQLGVDRVTTTFITVSTRLLLASMVPLAFGIALDFEVVARLLAGPAVALPLSLALLALFGLLWGIVPRWRWLRRFLGGG
jgi:hypothetical protein